MPNTSKMKTSKSIISIDHNAQKSLVERLYGEGAIKKQKTSIYEKEKERLDTEKCTFVPNKDKIGKSKQI